MRGTRSPEAAKPRAEASNTGLGEPVLAASGRGERGQNYDDSRERSRGLGVVCGLSLLDVVVSKTGWNNPWTTTEQRPVAGRLDGTRRGTTHVENVGRHHGGPPSNCSLGQFRGPIVIFSHQPRVPEMQGNTSRRPGMAPRPQNAGASCVMAICPVPGLVPGAVVGWRVMGAMLDKLAGSGISQHIRDAASPTGRSTSPGMNR